MLIERQKIKFPGGKGLGAIIVLLSKCTNRNF